MWDWSSSKGRPDGRLNKRKPNNPNVAYPNDNRYSPTSGGGWQNSMPPQPPPPNHYPNQDGYNYSQNPYAAPNYPPNPPNPRYTGGYPVPPPPQSYGSSGYAPMSQAQPPMPPPPNYNNPYNNMGYPDSMPPQPMPPQPAAMQDDFSVWEWQLENFDLPNMELQEAVFVSQTLRWKIEMKKAFKRARRDFLKFVGYHHVEECKACGIDEDGIKILRKGRSPENFNVHMKIPLDYLGTNDFSNLCLIMTYPYHNELHKFLDLQISRQPAGKRLRKLFIPVPSGKVYVPEGFGGSLGGKDKHDRSVYAGFLESTFESILLKSSMGRSSDG